MQIRHDHSYVTQAQQEFISRGYACEGLYSLRFSYALTEAQKAENRAYADEAGLGSDAWNTHIADSARRRSDHMERVATVLARNFKVYQYDGEEAVPYKSDWDLFFWCNDFSQTMRGLLSGRDYAYFTLSFNDKHTPERRQEVCDRVMRILEPFADDVNLDVAVQYTAIMDEDRIRRDAALIAPRIAGRSCVYGNMEGRVEQGNERLYFRKKRSRKYVYRLADAEILALSWQLSA